MRSMCIHTLHMQCFVQLYGGFVQLYGGFCTGFYTGGFCTGFYTGHMQGVYRIYAGFYTGYIQEFIQASLLVGRRNVAYFKVVNGIV